MQAAAIHAKVPPALERRLPDVPYFLPLIAVVFIVAGTVKGVLGGGLPSISIGLLSTLMPIPLAAALVVAPSFVTNVWQSFGPHFVALMRRIWLMLAGICVGAWLGAGLMTGAYAEWARVGLGLSLAIYAAIGLFNLRMSLPRASEPWLAPFVGIVTGFIAAGTGVFVIPSGPYLQAIGLKKNEMVQALGITFTVSTVVLGGVVAHAGALNTALLVPTAVALAASLAGMWIGQKLRFRLPEETFRKWFFVGLLLLGAHLTLQPFL
jgi:uncharacterized membrane protein YfcA